MGKKISTAAMIVLAAAIVGACEHDPLRRRPGETDLQYQQRLQEKQRLEQEQEQRRQMDEQMRRRSGESPEAQIERRRGILLGRLPAGSYAKDREQPCREGFKEHRAVIGQQVAEQGSGEIFYFCVPLS